MTHISTTAPVTVRHFSLPRPRLPKTGIAESLAAIAWLLGDALNLAYVDPYASRQSPPAASDADLQGRDPNW